MKMLKKTVAFIVIAAMLSMLTIFAVPMNVSAQGMVYYVDAVNGNDSTGDGSSSNPWKTINRAAGIMLSGDTCRIRSGIYRETVTPANSGSEAAYITFEADAGAEVTISGADLVTGSWSVHENNTYKTTKTLSMGDWKNQVFVDGVSMNLARWPNAGLDPMNPVFLSADTGTDNNKIIDSELTQPDGYWNGAAVITMDKTRWSMASGMVSSYTKGRLNITNIYTHGLGVVGEYGSPYYLVGKLAALDSANEWYYDKGTNTLYLQTPANDNPDNHIVEVKARNNGFNLENKDYIRIKGLNLFACTIDARIADYCEIDGIDAKYPSHYDFGHNGSEHYFKTSGILIGGTGNVLKNSTLAYSPGNLVTVSGVENKIINNVMHDAAYGAAYTCSTGCIWVDGQRHLVSHNTLYNSARNCISGTTIDCRIQYNHGYNAMTLLDDGGAIYLTSVDGNGTEIHHNVFHDVKANPPHFISGGIYLDFMSWDFKLYNNLTYNTNKFGIFFHSYNEFLHAYNNTFYNDSVFRMKDDGGALDGYGVRVVNNIAYEKISLARGFGIVEKNNLKVEPLFENPEAGNFMLQSASSGIDEGTLIRGITNDYTGNAPDIGAFEFGAEEWKAGHDFSSPPEPSFTTAEIQYNTLLVNGFFERETDTLGGWTKTHSKTAVIERSGNDATSSRHAWTRGVKLGSGEDGIEQTVTGLQPNTEYELRGFGKTATGSQEIRLGVKDFGGEEKYESVTSTSWTRKKIRFTTGENETNATIYVYKPTTGGLAYTDDVTLMEVDPEAPPEFEFDDDPIVTEPGITVINDRDLGTGLNQFEYVGSWGTNPSNMDAYKGDVTYSNTANDYYQVRFIGEQIRIYTEMDTNFGIIGVSIDGQPETMVDLYSSTPLDKTLVYESPVLTSGQHIMKVRITGEKNQNSGGTWVVADRVEVLKTPEMKIVNDRETGTGLYQFEYVGSWGTNPSNMDAYKGDVTYSNIANDYYQVRFEGVQISIYTEMDAHFGIIGVSIDGGDETLVDLYSSTSLDRTLVYKSPVLPSGRHILKVRVTGNKNDSSSGTWVVADRVDIALGDTETPPEQEIGVLYSQDFESTAVGTVPEGWIATTDNPVSVTQDDLGNHMLTIAESANGITSSATYNFEPIQIKMGIDFRVKAAQTSKHANFLTLKDINGTKVVELLFDLDYNHTGSHKIARRTPDNNWSNIMEYNANQWYDIHVDVDLVAGTYNVSIDDTVVVEKIPLLNAVNHVAQYVFSAYSWDKGTYHMDDLIISGIVAPQTNKAPAFSAIGDKSVNAGQMLTFTASATDADGDILFYSASNLPDGAQFDTTTGGFSWMPDENQVGNYTVSFQVSDGKLTDAVDVIITVLEAPSLPELGLVFEENFETTAVGAIPEGWAIETLGGTAAAAQMADGENLTNMALKIQRKTMNTSLFANKVFTPATGIVTIDVRMRNSQSNTLMNGPILKDSEGKDAIYVGFQRNGTFGVLNSGWQNLRPYAANQWYDIHIVADTDTDTYDLYIDGTLELKDKPFRNAVADISEIRFSPYSWDNGTVHYDNIIVKAGNVIPANEAPVINFIGSQAVNENQLLTFLVSAADANDDVLTYSALNLPEGAVFDTSTGVFTWVPGYEQAGSYSITFQVSDGSLTDSKDVDIVVNNINREPVFTAIEDKSVDEGKLLEFTILVADPDGDSITLTATNLPEGASFDTNSGVFTWMPDFSQAGEYVFNVGVTDGSLSSEVAIKVTVRNVAASEAVATLKSYMHDLGINKLSKDLLLKQLDAVTSQLNKNHSKQAMIKMKVFMLEIKIIEPRVISEDIAEEILKSCLDICIAIKADAQDKDSKWVDSKLDEIIEKMRQFKKNKITDSIYEDIIKKTDELINNMKD